jgi:hypothetical protein
MKIMREIEECKHIWLRLGHLTITLGVAEISLPKYVLR